MHLAVHLSRNFTRKVFVYQPRRHNGTFLPPVQRPDPFVIPRTVHITINGYVQNHHQRVRSEVRTRPEQGR